MSYQNRKIIITLLAILFLAATSNTSIAQYLLHGKQASISMDSLSKERHSKYQISTISVSGYINTANLYMSQYVPQPWEKLDPLVTVYEGRKIKKMMVQHSTGKVILFLKGKDVINFTEDAAIASGFLRPSPSPEIIRIDSPLYAGDRMLVHIKKQDPQDDLVSLSAPFKATENEYEYALQYYTPGTIWILETGYDGRTKRVFEYRVEWPAEQSTGAAPDFFPGEIRSTFVDYNLFKKQDKLTITNGYTLSGATVYFSGNGFSNVCTSTLTGPSFNGLRGFMEVCLPGTDVTFDNVSVLDASGNKILLQGKSYKLIDSLDIRKNYAPLINMPDFPGGTYGLVMNVLQNLAALPPERLIKGRVDMDLSFIVETDGTLTEVFDKKNYVKNRLDETCYEMIRQSATWIPGTYKGEKMRMMVNVQFSIVME